LLATVDGADHWFPTFPASAGSFEVGFDSAIVGVPAVIRDIWDDRVCPIKELTGIEKYPARR
jgi:hypothetical protein